MTDTWCRLLALDYSKVLSGHLLSALDKFLPLYYFCNVGHVQTVDTCGGVMIPGFPFTMEVQLFQLILIGS